VPWLTKSRFMAGWQCPKRLWFEIHRPLEVPVPDSLPFINGRAVDAAVQASHPGTVVSRDRGLPAAIAETAKILSAGAPPLLYQPAFRHGECAIVADVLRKTPTQFELVEVKASTSLKDQHIPDAAFQALVMRNARIPIADVFISRVNDQFVLQNKADYGGLMIEENITSKVDSLQLQIADAAAALQEVMASRNAPAIQMGRQCGTPYKCPFIDRCTRESGRTADFPLSVLPNATRVIAALEGDGYDDLCAVPAERLTSELHRRVHTATLSGVAFFDAAAAQVLRDLPYPRAYLDFETISLAVPEIVGARPYEHLPFQWSLHVEDAPGALRHAEYLALESFGDFERLAQLLLAALPRAGPVLAYNAGFERRVIQGLADRLPQYSQPLIYLSQRLVDLLAVTKSAYYHRDMRGSWSIKAVLRTIATQLDYAQLHDVQEGEAAQLTFLELRRSRPDHGRRERLTQALRDYCRHDTWGMVVLRRFLCGEDLGI
jgi:hypothetical protein